MSPSIFTAELTAIKYALKIVKQTEKTKFAIFTDSRSAVDALKQYTHQNNIIGSIRRDINALHMNNKTVEICWIPANVGVRGNEAADEEAKRAIDKRPAKIRIPITDHLNIIKNHVNERWQNEWRMTNNNKESQLTNHGRPAS